MSGIFQGAVQQGNLWINDVQARLPRASKHDAYAALRATLHTLRDRLPQEGVLGLSAQLPMLIRGLFLEGWRPGDGPTSLRSEQDFFDAACHLLPTGYVPLVSHATRAVLAVLSDHIDPGETAKLIAYLPEPMRGVWPADYASE